MAYIELSSAIERRSSAGSTSGKSTGSVGSALTPESNCSTTHFTLESASGPEDDPQNQEVASIFKTLELGLGVNKRYVSLLNELQQKGFIKDLDWVDSNVEKGFWTIKGSASHFLGKKETAAGMGLKKAEAKENAAKALYGRFWSVCVANPMPDERIKDMIALAMRQRPKTAKQVKVLEEAERHADRLRAVQDRPGCLIVALDVEVNEDNHTQILEIGLTFGTYLPQSQQYAVLSTHYINQDLECVRNSKHVADNKYGYVYSDSTFVKNAELIPVVHVAVEESTCRSLGGIIIGHTIQSDLKWLKAAGLELQGDGTIFCDIAMVEQSITSNYEREGLEKIAGRYGVEIKGIKGPGSWHNAGNDARATWDIAIKQLERLIGVKSVS